jgi:predicted transcriptional regulator
VFLRKNTISFMPQHNHHRHTLELPPELWESLEQLNVECGKDQTPRLLEVIADFLADELAFVARLKKSIEQAENGEFASPEKVASFFAKYDC